MRYRQADGVICEMAGDRAVLMTVAGTELVTLNPVGSMIWCELEHTITIDQIAAALRDAFPDVAEDVLRSDAAGFLTTLEARDIVVAVG